MWVVICIMRAGGGCAVGWLKWGGDFEFWKSDDVDSKKIVWIYFLLAGREAGDPSRRRAGVWGSGKGQPAIECLLLRSRLPMLR